MLENLKRIREPLAWAVLAVVVLAVVTSVARALVYGNPDEVADYAYWALAAQARWSLHLVVLVAAVGGCAIPPALPRAPLLATVAAWTATAVVALPLVAVALVAVAAGVPPVFLPSVLDIIPDTLLGIVAVVALWALARRRPDRDGVAAEEPALPAAESAPDDRPSPVWRRDDAAGTAWRTADEAAAGAPGSSSLATPEEPEATRAP